MGIKEFVGPRGDRSKPFIITKYIYLGLLAITILTTTVWAILIMAGTIELPGQKGWTREGVFAIKIGTSFCNIIWLGAKIGEVLVVAKECCCLVAHFAFMETLAGLMVLAGSFHPPGTVAPGAGTIELILAAVPNILLAVVAIIFSILLCVNFNHDPFGPECAKRK